MTSEVIAWRRLWPQALCTAGKLAGSANLREDIMNSIVPSTSLKRALLADACVSGAVALLQLVAYKPLASYTGISSVLLLGTGVFLVGYVGLLIVLALRESVWSSLIWLVVAGNLGWAVAALCIAAAQPLTALGAAFALVHAVSVTTFAYLEYRGLGASEHHLARA
jgi:hypothetical protein